MTDRDVHSRHHIHGKTHHLGIADAVREISPDLVERIGNIDAGAVHVRAVLEFELDHGKVFRVDGIDVFHALHGAEGTFKGLRDLGLHAFGRSAGIGRDDQYERNAHRRKKVRRKPHDRDHAKSDRDDDRDQNGKWFPDTVSRHSVKTRSPPAPRAMHTTAL